VTPTLTLQNKTNFLLSASLSVSILDLVKLCYCFYFIFYFYFYFLNLVVVQTIFSYVNGTLGETLHIFRAKDGAGNLVSAHAYSFTMTEIYKREQYICTIL